MNLYNNTIRRWSLITLLLFFIACGKNSTPSPPPPPPPPPGPSAKTFTNPLLSSGPDPWVLKKDDNYYYMHTTGNNITLWRTKTMSNLSQAISQPVFFPPATGANSRNVWAPELHYLDGKWYLYYTAGSSTVADLSMQRTFVLENSAADPFANSWVDKGQLFNAGENFWAIDGSILELNGLRYFIWSGHQTAVDNTQNIYISKMTNPWTLEGSRVKISSPQLSWETVGTPDVNEGPEALKGPTGKTFIVYSASGCFTDDYALGMLTLKDGGNPLIAADWTKTPTPVFKRDDNNGAFGPGHNAFFKSPDGAEDWIIYHANALAGQGCGDARKPRMQKFTWNGDGTPNFGVPVKINTAINVPSGE
jgi:GH43 family beta-xylosidase